MKSKRDLTVEDVNRFRLIDIYIKIQFQMDETIISDMVMAPATNGPGDTSRPK
jgi:hypothetical protein